MLKERIKECLSKRGRLRLTAGMLALTFGTFSLLPWMHMLTLGSCAGHTCSHPVSAAAPVSPAPTLSSEGADASDTCWVCQSLASLMQHTERTDASAFTDLSLPSAYVARAQQERVFLPFYPANRSQAPPASA